MLKFTWIIFPWIKAHKKDPVHKKIMETKEALINEDSFNPNEVLSGAVDKRMFLLKKLSFFKKVEDVFQIMMTINESR